MRCGLTLDYFVFFIKICSWMLAILMGVATGIANGIFCFELSQVWNDSPNCEVLFEVIASFLIHATFSVFLLYFPWIPSIGLVCGVTFLFFFLVNRRFVQIAQAGSEVLQWSIPIGGFPMFYVTQQWLIVYTSCAESSVATWIPG